MSSKKIGLSEITYFVICISPFLAYLESGFIGTYIPLALEFCYIIAQICKHKWIIKLTFLFFIIWLVFVTIVNYRGNTTSVNRMVGELVTLLTVVMISQDTKAYKFLTIYKVIAKACLIYFFAQVVLMYTISFPLQFTLPFFPVKDELELAFNFLSYYNRSMTYIRFPGPFSEPSHYAAYLIPLLAILLFDDEKKLQEKWKLPVLISITMVISTSGVGILLCTATWGMYFAFNYSTTKNRLMLLPFIVMAAATMFSLLMMYNEQFSITVSNLFRVQDQVRFATGSKADYRIYRGFAMYQQLPVLNKLFGVGFANMNDFAISHNIRTIYDIATSQTVEYYNGISQILLYSGLVGFCLWIKGIIGYSKKMKKVGKMILVLYIIYLVGSGNLFSGYSSIFLICAVLAGKEYMHSREYDYNSRYLGIRLNRKKVRC